MVLDQDVLALVVCYRVGADAYHLWPTADVADLIELVGVRFGVHVLALVVQLDGVDHLVHCHHGLRVIVKNPLAIQEHVLWAPKFIEGPQAARVRLK